MLKATLAPLSRYGLSKHRSLGLHTGCKVAVLAPMVEAARLPRRYPMPLGCSLPPL